MEKIFILAGQMVALSGQMGPTKIMKQSPSTWHPTISIQKINSLKFGFSLDLAAKTFIKNLNRL